MHFTVSELGALMLVFYGLSHWLGIFHTLRAYAAFVGTVIVGSAGFFGHLLTAVGTWAQSAGGAVLQWAIGVPLVAAPALAVFFVLIHDLHPKNTAGKRTGLLAILAGAFVVAGVAGIPALSGLHTLIINLVGNLQTAL
jgi:hypothetical protein